MIEPCSSCVYEPSWLRLENGDYVGVCKMHPHPPLIFERKRKWIIEAESDDMVQDVCTKRRTR